MDLLQAPTLSPVLVYKNKTDMIAFSKIVVPSSMRSALWKYFGFPADKYNNIITKQKIVCSICRTPIAYNKNTTNMHTHLNAKHPQIIKEFFPNFKQEKKDGKSVQTPSDPDDMRAKRMKLQTNTDDVEDGNGAMSIKSIVPQEHPTGISAKTAVLSTTDDPDSQNDMQFMDQDERHELIEVLDVNTDYIELNNDQFDMDTELEQTHIEHTTENSPSDDRRFSVSVLDPEDLSQFNRRDDEQLRQSISGVRKIETDIAEIEVPVKLQPVKNVRLASARSSLNIEEQLTQFIVTDLVSPDILDGKGFQQFVSKLYGDEELPSSVVISRSLTYTYDYSMSEVLLHLQSILINSNYSISLEKWFSNAVTEGSAQPELNTEFISVFVNYIDSKRGRAETLQSQVLCVAKGPLSKDFWMTYIEDVLPIEMCKAVVVNFEIDDGDDVINYWRYKQIPLIQSLPTVIEIAINKCLAIDRIDNALTEIQSLLNDISDEELSDKPDINHDFWLTKLNLIIFFLEKVDHSEITSGLPQTLQTFVQCATPLKNCLEILSQEKQTQACLMRPLTHQLVEQYYTIEDEADESLECEIRQIISTDLNEKILNNWFLTVASFADPRFLGLINPDLIPRIKDELQKSCDENEEGFSGSYPRIAQIKSEDSRSTPKKIGLSSFFRFNKTEQKKTPKNRFDVEFRSYLDDVNVEIDECPLAWWSSSDYIYPILRQAVQQYQCVPCTVGDFGWSLKDKIRFFRKRQLMSTDLERKLLWLHYNDESKSN